MIPSNITDNRYTWSLIDASSNTYDWVIDSSGAAPGVEWNDEYGNAYRIVMVSHPTFSYKNRIVITDHEYFLKQTGSTEWSPSSKYVYQDRLDDTSDFRYNDPTQSNFGQVEPNPYNADGSLKTGLVTEAQFFIDNIVYNIYQIANMSIGNYAYMDIKTQMNVKFGIVLT